MRRSAVFSLAVLPVLLSGGVRTALDAQVPARADLAARIDSIVTSAMSATGAPGLSVAVVRGSDTITLKGYGLADVENNVPVTDRTVFRIGSITKQFTAAAIMKLVEEGRVRLDAPLSEYLPDYEGPGARATIHQLLNHTSGIPSYTGLGDRFWSRSRLDLTHEELLALFAADSLEFEPGSRWAYNNSGYYLLGVILEKLTGQPYRAHVRSTQFEPLGLAQTVYCDEKPIVPHRAEGYAMESGTLVNDEPLSMHVPGAAGALCSTPRDLVRWTRALAGGRVVSQETYRRMTTPTSLSDGRTQAYGYGLVPAQLHGHQAIQHGGGIHGFNAFMSHWPAQDLTVVVLANGPTNSQEVHGGIVRAVLGVAEPAAAVVEEEAVTTAELEPYVGTFTLEPAAPLQVRVFIENGRLMAQGTGQSAFPLRSTGDDAFASPDEVGIRLVFTVEGGRATSFTLHQGGARIVARRID